MIGGKTRNRRQTGPVRFIALLELVLTAAVAPSAFAQTTMIEAVGIDQGSRDQNFSDFYQSAEDFLKYCRRIGLQHCQLYLDRNSNHAANPKGAEMPSWSQGPSDASTVLNAFKNALIQAQPGDQVVLSLVDHGTPGVISPSCVLMSKGFICKNDVQNLIDRYKKSGVRILISAEACFSGAFTELSSPEVCTFASAGQKQEGHYIDFWPTVAELRSKSKGPFTLRDIDSSKLRLEITADGGGFGSDMIQNRICQNEDAAGMSNGDADLINTLIQVLDVLNKELIYGFPNADSCAPSPEPSDTFWYLEGQIPGLTRVQKILCRSTTVEDKTACAALTGLVPELTSPAFRQAAGIEKSYWERTQELESIDDRIRQRHPQDSKGLEAKRGKLLQQMVATERDWHSEELALLQSVPFLERALSNAMGHVCYFFKPVQPLAFGERVGVLASNLLPSQWSNAVPSSNQALRDALKCEDNFVFP